MEPPRPSQNVFWCSFSLTRSGSTALSPIKSGFKTYSEAATKSALVKTVPTPTIHESVLTEIKV